MSKSLKTLTADFCEKYGIKELIVLHPPKGCDAAAKVLPDGKLEFLDLTDGKKKVFSIAETPPN